MRYRLRTLLIVLAIGPPAIAALWPLKAQYNAWKLREEMRRHPFPTPPVRAGRESVDGTQPRPTYPSESHPPPKATIAVPGSSDDLRPGNRDYIH